MKITLELFEKAKQTKSAEELRAFAKENGIELTEEEATKCFAEFHKEGELADEELDNVAGGGCLFDDGYSRPDPVTPIKVVIPGGNIYYCPYCSTKMDIDAVLWDSNDDNTCHYPYYHYVCESGHTIRCYYFDDEWTVDE